MYTIDFETYEIKGRPNYPPRPVGVSIQHGDGEPVYYSWGHLTGSNACSYSEIGSLLRTIWDSGEDLLFHNAKFDLDVWATWFSMPEVVALDAWERIHDTMLLLFLDDPNQLSLGLKPSAERLLNMPPEEQNIMANWLVENQPVKGVRITASEKGKNTFNRFIPYAPANIVGCYANGDVERTKRLYDLVYGKVQHTMEGAYNRERQLLLILLDIERQGVRLDCTQLTEHIKVLENAYSKLEHYIGCLLITPDSLKVKRLEIGGNDKVNLNSGRQLLQALKANNKIDTSKIGLTPKGNECSDKKTLMDAITDKRLAACISHYRQIGTCLKTFLKPWAAVANNSRGRVYSSWRQTKSGEAGSIGARTGRLSSSPNFQNIPTTFKPLFKTEDQPDLPKEPIIIGIDFKEVRESLNIRSLIIPSQDDHVLIGIDWQQQELRLLAHYEDEVLLAAYQHDDKLDAHKYAQELIFDTTGQQFDRKVIKGVGFGLLYGMGIAKLAATSDISHEDASIVKEAYLNIFPGVRKLSEQLKSRASFNKPLRTWGGRLYHCEPDKMINGELRSFDYKMLNTLIQGSAADCLKEAIIQYYCVKPESHQLLLTVHDEILISVPKSEQAAGVTYLQEAMEGLPLDVKLLTDVKIVGERWV